MIEMFGPAWAQLVLGPSNCDLHLERFLADKFRYVNADFADGWG
jgi:hypothetical protein